MYFLKDITHTKKVRPDTSRGRLARNSNLLTTHNSKNVTDRWTDRSTYRHGKSVEPSVHD